MYYKVVCVLKSGRKVSIYIESKDQHSCPGCKVITYKKDEIIEAPKGSAGIFLLGEIPDSKGGVYRVASASSNYPIEIYEVEPLAEIIVHSDEELRATWGINCGADYPTCSKIKLGRFVKAW
jgi:hypothetical protein